MKTSLGIWAFGTMATRFVPGGCKPELARQSRADRVRRAVDGLGDLIDGYEFHSPQELSPDNLGEVRDALGGHDRRFVLHWRFIESVAARIDDAALSGAQSRKDAVAAYELVYAALGA